MLFPAEKAHRLLAKWTAKKRVDQPSSIRETNSFKVQQDYCLGDKECGADGSNQQGEFQGDIDARHLALVDAEE